VRGDGEVRGDGGVRGDVGETGDGRMRGDGFNVLLRSQTYLPHKIVQNRPPTNHTFYIIDQEPEVYFMCFVYQQLH